MTERYTFTTDAVGYENQSPYCDKPGDIATSIIGRIEIWYDLYINGLTVHYVGSTQPAVRRGVGRGTMAEVVLHSGQWIAQIEASYYPQVISSLKFLGNTGRTWGPFGRVVDTEFIMDPGQHVPAHLAPYMGLLYFSGCSDQMCIRLLRATFAGYLGPRRATEIPHTQSSGIRSAFTRDMMSPIITLRIGLERTEIRAYEATLCRLPFFRAALQGNFEASAENAIILPEHDPESIGALLEFLYTGSYTYTFQPPVPPGTADEDIITISDVSQGSFHVAVYDVASKCDCEVLGKSALNNFTHVLKQLTGMDIITLLQEAYVKGLYLSKLEADPDLRVFMNGLADLVGDVYGTHGEEMNGMVERYPGLASDLLRLVTRRGR